MALAQKHLHLNILRDIYLLIHKTNYTYTNFNIKCSTSPHTHTIVDLYICLGYSLACGAQLFHFCIRHKYVTHIEKRLHVSYEQKRKHVQTYNFTPQLSVNICVWFNGELLHTRVNHFDTTVYIQ